MAGTTNENENENETETGWTEKAVDVKNDGTSNYMHDKNDAPDAHKTPPSTPTNLEAIDETRLAVGAAKQPGWRKGPFLQMGGVPGRGLGTASRQRVGSDRGKAASRFRSVQRI